MFEHGEHIAAFHGLPFLDSNGIQYTAHFEGQAHLIFRPQQSDRAKLLVERGHPRCGHTHAAYRGRRIGGFRRASDQARAEYCERDGAQSRRDGTLSRSNADQFHGWTTRGSCCVPVPSAYSSSARALIAAKRVTLRFNCASVSWRRPSTNSA